MKRSISLALAMLAIPAAAHAAGDPVKGKTVYARCISCHALKGPQLMGPNLIGIAGRRAASGEGARYSAALKASGIVWDDAKLDAYLTNTTKLVPGTSMVMAVPNAQDRADVIAYLKTLTPPSP